MYKVFYELSMKNKEELKNSIEGYSLEFYEDEGRFIVLEEDKKNILKIAYNKEGLFQNYLESKKYLDLCFEAEENNRGVVKSFLYKYFNEIHFFDGYNFLSGDKVISSMSNRWGNDKKLISKDVKVIKKPYHGEEHNKLSNVYYDTKLYYPLKKALLDIEFKAIISKIYEGQFKIYLDMIKFIDTSGIHPKRVAEYSPPVCLKCSRGLLRFNIEHFLKNGTSDKFESKYICSNSNCKASFSSSDINKGEYITDEEYRVEFDKIWLEINSSYNSPFEDRWYEEF